MAEQMLDIDSIEQQLDKLESEIRNLRHLIQPAKAADATLPDTKHPSIISNPAILNGEPILSGTRTSVRAIVEYWKFGITPEEIVRKLPYLRLAQIFDALSYYDTHRQEIEQYIARNRVPVDE